MKWKFIYQISQNSFSIFFNINSFTFFKLNFSSVALKKKTYFNLTNYLRKRSTTNWHFEVWLKITLKNNIIKMQETSNNYFGSKKKKKKKKTKQVLQSSCILWCYFSKCYSIIFENTRLWWFIVIYLLHLAKLTKEKRNKLCSFTSSPLPPTAHSWSRHFFF